VAINLAELAQGYFTGPVTRQISGMLGESEVATESAIGAAVPSVIAGLMKQASTPNGASALSASLDRIDTSFLGNLGATISGGTQKLVDTGSSLVRSLFGNSLGSVSDVIGRASGIGKGAMGSLLGLVTPVVMGLLARQKKAQGLEANGLSNLLADQKQFVAGHLPSGVGDALGLTSLAGSAREAGRFAYETSHAAVGAVARAGVETVDRGTSVLRKILPFLLIAALGLVAWGVLSARRGSTTVTHAAGAAATQVDAAKRQITAVFGDATGALSNITDEASARAALPSLEEAARSVSSMTSGWQTMPQVVRDGVGQVVRSMQPNLQSLADKALAIPGVRGVIEPALKTVMDGIAKLRG
jgi:Bacterial protein of unknown function (DUF937)